MNILRKLFRIDAVVLTLFPMAAHAQVESPPRPEGWLPHFESIIALAIVLTAVLIAWLLNHARPKKRALGTLLAALSCFGIVVWFIAALGTGVIDNPKKFQTPMDAAKPALLWMQTLAALFGGIVLLMVAKGCVSYLALDDGHFVYFHDTNGDLFLNDSRRCLVSN